MIDLIKVEPNQTKDFKETKDVLKVKINDDNYDRFNYYNAKVKQEQIEIENKKLRMKDEFKKWAGMNFYAPIIKTGKTIKTRNARKTTGKKTKK
jgi:hypothetical protein